MSSTSAVTVAIGALAVAMTFAASQPAAAGPACNELELRSPCIKSNDIRPNIVLGGPTGDGRLRLRNEDRANAVDLQASTGNVTNLFSNDEDESNGLVKAWARINPDGTIAACWRCNRDTGETRRLTTGQYEIDFTPLATDITGRPLLADIDRATFGFILHVVSPSDPSSVLVTTAGSDDVQSDRPFVLIIF